MNRQTPTVIATVFIGLLLWAVLFWATLMPLPAHASTLTAPQVSAIIGLLRAFGVEEKTITIVYNQLTPTAQSTPITVTPTPAPASAIPDTPAPAQEATAPTVSSTPEPVPLTCSLSATVVLWTQGTYHAKFAWSFTDGATAKVTEGGVDIGRWAPGSVSLGNALTPIYLSSSAHQTEVFGPTIQLGSAHTYSLVVQKNDYQVTCDTNI